MSDAQTVLRRVVPRQRPPLSLDRYLEACRTKGALNQEQRAHLFGLGRNTVSRYELGKVEPLVSTAQRIAARLDLKVEDLWPAA